MNQEQPVYLSYLLRLWSMKVNGDTVWRASVESGVTGECQPFADLDDLSRYLRRQTCADRHQTRVGSDEVDDEAP